MAYFNDIFLKPAKSSIFKWKRLFLVTLIEILVIIFLFFVYTSAYNHLLDYSRIIESHNLQDSAVVISMVDVYQSEAAQLVARFYVVGFVLLIITFLTYLLSRWVTWMLTIGKKIKFRKFLLLDSIFFFLLLFFLIITIEYVRPEFYMWFLAFFVLPLMYYSFLSHIHIDKTYKDISKNVCSLKTLYILPHTIIVIFIFSLLNHNLVLLGIAILIINYYRFMVSNIVRS
ncbi:MAG: hypothetical protein ACMXYG_05930 [Candidatus Woesearchaeota archaeon]